MYLKVETPSAASKLSELLKDGDWMVLYYAEWCGHCNAMKPEWQKVIEKLKDSGSINIADVKSDVIEALKHKPQIEGFPSIKMYNKGKEVAKFEDERSAEKMEKFAISNSNSKSNSSGKRKTVKTIDNSISSPPEVKLNLDEVETVEAIPAPAPISSATLTNDTDVKKMSISQLKDEIMKSHRKTASQELTATANNVIEIKNETMPVNTPSEAKSNLTELDMLLQPPTPSAKASKKRQTRKATPIALHNQSSQHNKRNNKKNNKNHSRGVMPVIPAMPAADMSCSNINRAKQCKSNPKCFYDYVEFKCKDKSERPALQFPKLAGSKKRSKKTQKEKQPNQPSMRNNKKNTTKELLQALQKSFKTIGNEARQDSKLLAKASERI